MGSAFGRNNLFCQAVGAARSGDPVGAKQAIEKLTVLRDKTEKASAYWAKQVEIQRLSAIAWLMYQEGRKDVALKTMKTAAELESSTEKHSMTPGEILPARELLADMLLEMGRYQEARIEYETALERSANRFNSLFGAGRAAELSGNPSQAAAYDERLVETTENASTHRKPLAHAKLYLLQSRGSS
jgi:tetratricopeptide (TPR) repeat protein